MKKKKHYLVIKTKMGKRELILEVCELHKRFCISTCELLSKFLLCEKRGMKATNLLKLYMNCNFSRSITETLTMLAPMLGLD